MIIEICTEHARWIPNNSTDEGAPVFYLCVCCYSVSSSADVFVANKWIESLDELYKSMLKWKHNT
jgi:hypothetical protein